MLNILGQLLFGLIIGAIARFLLPGKEAITPGIAGWLITALIGLAGSFIGAMISRAIWGGEKNLAGWIMSILGAVILLIIYRMVM
jgi:uncharacterized membrane protein YeaQ/YmgE (transglycosylase-associated protein family)